jgi:hypothetical protein
MNKKMKIVGAVIAGNEEQLIERCILSLKKICDQIVVVRAIGSANPDRTLDIASELGCVVGEYQNHPLLQDWPHVDDFSAARNQAFKIAYEIAGKDGLVTWADCDDIIEENMVEKTIAACNSMPADCDWMLTEYVVPEAHKRVPRERFFRYRTGWWHKPIHENVQAVNDVKINIRRDIEILHQPQSGKNSGARNRAILLNQDKLSSYWKFYLHYENFIRGNRADCVRYGTEALAMSDLDAVYRYETLVNCASLAAMEDALRLADDAIRTTPDRREAYGLRATLLLDCVDFKEPTRNNEGILIEAEKTLNQMLAVSVPAFPQWTHRKEWYGWKADALRDWILRMKGDAESADKIKKDFFAKSKLPSISLIHATRGRPIKATKCMMLWIERAKHPEMIEHIFCIDADDPQIDFFNRFKKEIQNENGFSVGAWNLGAKKSSGDIIVQLSDDWEPPLHWDEEIASRLDLAEEQVLRVSDGYRKDDLICMAILTRKYYENYGLFNPLFRNVYSDTDFTYRAAKSGKIIEARDLVFLHHHPFFENGEMDETYQRGNSPDEYQRAKAIFDELHPK